MGAIVWPARAACPSMKRCSIARGVIRVANTDDSDQVYLKAANQTFHQADNLAGQTAYTVRVRAFTGTLTDPEAGEWSESSTGMTGVAPVIPVELSDHSPASGSVRVPVKARTRTV